MKRATVLGLSHRQRGPPGVPEYIQASKEDPDTTILVSFTAKSENLSLTSSGH